MEIQPRGKCGHGVVLEFCPTTPQIAIGHLILFPSGPYFCFFVFCISYPPHQEVELFSPILQCKFVLFFCIDQCSVVEDMVESFEAQLQEIL